LGHPGQHASGELARDSGSMPLGISMLQGSHCGSNRTGGDCGIGGHGGNRHQRSWMTQLLLSAPLVRHHLSFQSKKNLEATIPLVIPFIWGVLFGMHLVNLQETQVVCR
jgi:hypothetical protein